MQRVPLMIQYGIWYPQVLESAKIADDIVRLQAKQRISHIDFYMAQWHTFSDAIKVMEPRLVILDEFRSFSPLFRCVLALKYNIPGVLNQYAGEARKELAQQPVAAELFPDEVAKL